MLISNYSCQIACYNTIIRDIFYHNASNSLCDIIPYMYITDNSNRTLKRDIITDSWTSRHFYSTFSFSDRCLS